jgi:hypothetical protein
LVPTLIYVKQKPEATLSLHAAVLKKKLDHGEPTREGTAAARAALLTALGLRVGKNSS